MITDRPLQLEKMISLMVTPRLEAKLQREAKRNGVSRSRIIRALLYRGLDWMDRAPAPEVFAALDYENQQNGLVQVDFHMRGDQ